MLVVECIKSYFSSAAHYVVVAIVLKLLSVFYPDTGFHYYSCTANLILYILRATFTYHACKHVYYYEKVDVAHKAVLITGCDRGFGHRLAQRLYSKGFHVFASCLFPEGEGAKQLKQKCSARLYVLYMDVTKEESIDKALQFVQENIGSNVLWAVVNNAGISKGFSTDFSSIDDFKDTIDVNALGPVRVSKAFLPLLKKSKGRIVNVTSLSARFPMVQMTPYTMSKCAARGFTESLNLEMSAWGVRAISIEPEFIRTAIISCENVIRRLEIQYSKVPEHILSSYGGGDYLKKMKKFFIKMDSKLCEDLDFVVDSMEVAITHKYPFNEYKPRRNLTVWFICYLFECILPFELCKQGIFFILKMNGYPIPKGVN